MSYNPFYNIENPQLMGYEYAWVSFMKNGEINNTIIAEEISRSWQRCKNKNIFLNVQGEKFSGGRRREDPVESFLIQNGGKLVSNIFEILEDGCFYGIITDNQGKKLFGMGNNRGEFPEKLTKVEEIQHFSEKYIGTNSFSVVSEISRPFSVAGAQHYFECFHGLAGYVAPIFDDKEEMVGMVGFYTIAEHMDDYLISFAVAVERAIENSMRWFDIQKLVEKEKSEKQLILDTMSDGVVYVSSEGKIIHCNRKLFELLGQKSKSLIGEDIKSLTTNPSVADLKKYPFSTRYSTCDNKISITNSRGESLQCFFNKYRTFEYELERGNEIWVFTVYSDIKKLAQKLSAGNTSRYTFKDIKSKSKSMEVVIELAKKASDFQVSTVIEGDSGTGKEMLAQAIHGEGPRKKGPFIALDCGALPSGLLESELFGYEEGAYTGARKGGKMGKFELANKGVLFLDEITNMPWDMQAKLLRALQERKIVRIGGSEPIDFDVQVIAATNKDIVEEIEQKNFRRDLFYRLNIIHIKIPPLTERENDMKMFTQYFMNKFNPKGDMKIDKEAMDILCRYEWPGNVRQLENVIERMVIISNSKTIGRECIPDEILKNVGESLGISEIEFDQDQKLEAICRKYVQKTVERYDNNVKKAAEILGISRVTVYKYLNSGKEEQ